MIEGPQVDLLYFLVLIRFRGGLEKHDTISRSSIEAEYKIIVNATTELMWLQTLQKELRIHHPPATILWCDNLDVTYLSTNLIFHV
jgi:hypothetical protein